VTGGRLPDGLRRGPGGDSLPAILSEGLVLCERCQMVCEGGSEEDRMRWLMNHDCKPDTDGACGVCGGDCGPIFCWDKGHAR